MIQTEARLQTVENVRQYLGGAADLQPAFEAELAAEQYFGTDCDQESPTIGCEIELRWTDLFPDLAKEFLGEPDEKGIYPCWVDDLGQKAQSQLRLHISQRREDVLPIYQSLEALGIPAGKDAVWEFAFRPTYSAQLAATEIGLLFASEVLPEAKNPLHVTLGGLAIDEQVFGYLTMFTELFGSTGQRIREGIPPADEPQINMRWARKLSSGGWAPRHKYEFVHPDLQSGIEIRSLVASSAEQTHRTLVVAQTLGRAALQHEKGQSSTWDEITYLAKSILRNAGLPDTAWRSPADKPELWQDWASVLDDQSTVANMREEVLDILDESFLPVVKPAVK